MCRWRGRGLFLKGDELGSERVGVRLAGEERGRKKEVVPAKAPEAVRPRVSAVRMGVGEGMVPTSWVLLWAGWLRSL